MRGDALGVDVGASLAKLVQQRPDGSLAQRLFPAGDRAAVLEAVVGSKPGTLGLTGCGASSLAEALGRAATPVQEFAAWGAGARELLRRQGHEPARHLLVSLGTGTSAMLVDGLSVSRVGGTALGGGTLLGLAAGLLGVHDHGQLVELAARGDRRRVDLLVSDIYEPGQIPLMGDITASAFGKLGRPGMPEPGREDLAHAIIGLVAENVALLCGGLAAAAQLSRVVYAGASLRENPVLRDTLHGVTSAVGREPLFPADGEFAGALGALLLASDPP